MYFQNQKVLTFIWRALTIFWIIYHIQDHFQNHLFAGLTSYLIKNVGSDPRDQGKDTTSKYYIYFKTNKNNCTKFAHHKFRSFSNDHSTTNKCAFDITFTVSIRLSLKLIYVFYVSTQQYYGKAGKKLELDVL